MGPRPTRLRLALATTFTWMVAWVLKARSAGFHLPGIPLFSTANDIALLYTERGYAHGQMPYVQSFNEYPPLTGLLQWLLALDKPGLAADFTRTAIVNLVLAIFVAMVLASWRPGDRRLWLWVLSPSLALYALHNWDLLAVALATGGLLSYYRGRHVASAILLALGACAKWYPGLFLGILAADLWRKEGRIGPATRSFVGIGFGVAAVVHLPFLLANAHLLAKTYSFHAARSANEETPWWIVAQLLQRAGHSIAGATVMRLAHDGLLPLFAGAAAWLAWRVRQGRLEWLTGCLAVLLAFLLLGKVFSIQYLLWVAPFLVVLDVPGRLVAALWVADAWVNVAVMGYLVAAQSSPPPSAWMFDKLALGVAMRAAVLLWLLLWSLRRSASSRNPMPRPASSPVEA
jgi:uncharacterized membrane protein